MSPFCTKCGAEIGDDAAFCPACGKPVGKELPFKKREGMKTVLLIFGALILAVGVIGLIMGAFLLSVGREGFVVKPRSMMSDAYAMIIRDIDIEMDETSGTWGEIEWDPGEFVTLVFTGYSNDESKNLFIGIAKEGDAEAYLEDVEYDRIVGSELTKISPFRGGMFEFQFETQPGDRRPTNPVDQNFWVASAHGNGTQTLEWELETGKYWIVFMNEDGSTGMDVNLEIEIKVPGLFTVIGYSVIAGAIVAVVIGGLVVYLGTRPKL